MNVKNTVAEKQEEAFSSLKDNSLLEYLLILITDISNQMKDSLNIAIAGATGYIGIQLVKILSRHPKVKISYLCANKSAGKSIYDFDKSIKKRNLPKITKINKINIKKIDVLFASLPNGEAQKIARTLPKNIKLIDLSGDFRLDDYKSYKKWYGINHKCKNLIKKSIYSLTEFSRNDLYKYNIISCPGCYPTSIQIPLIPLLIKRAISTNNIIIDSKSGYSGAGKNIKKKFNYKNLFQSVGVYGVGSHKHMPEIDQQLSKAANIKIKVIFTPHLIPMFRGILSTIYLETKKKYNVKKIHSLLTKYHKNNYFIKIAKINTPINTGDVMNTNFCKISVCNDRKSNRIIIVSAIDNLIKGGSGQAVQNMNAAFNIKENIGLL